MYKILIFVPLLFCFKLSIAQAGKDNLNVGDSEYKAIRIMKEAVAKDSELTYKTRKEWDQKANGYTTSHTIYSDDIQVAASICFDNKVLYVINLFSALCGVNFDYQQVVKFKNALRNSNGNKLGLKYVGDNVYEYSVISPNSYVSIITFSSNKNIRVTMWVNTFNKGSLKILTDKIINDHKSKGVDVTYEFL